jgi:hypothetical protein
LFFSWVKGTLTQNIFCLKLKFRGTKKSWPTNLPCGVLEPSKGITRNYGAFKVRFEEFWSNATCAPHFNGDKVIGQKISIKIIQHFYLSYFVKVIFETTVLSEI